MPCVPDPKDLLERLAAAAESAMPPAWAADLRGNLRASLRGALERMELVTREELEIQKKVLERTREKLTVLEARLAELERRSSSSGRQD
jgi:BMFP domain-containing protein YqiC